MKLEGNEAPLTLKKNWGDLEISSFSGRQWLYNQIWSLLNSRKSQFTQALCSSTTQNPLKIRTEGIWAVIRPISLTKAGATCVTPIVVTHPALKIPQR